MEKLLSKINQFTLIQAIIFFALGLFLLLKPIATMSIIVNTLAIFILLQGVFSFILFLKYRENSSWFNYNLITGITQIIFALIIFIFPQSIASLLPVVVGIIVVISSSINIARAVQIKKFVSKGWLVGLIFSIVTALAGVLIIINPFSAAIAFTQICGVLLVLKGVEEFTIYFSYRNAMK